MLNGAVAGGAAVANLAVMWIAGTDHAVLWAVVGFLLAFVPFGFIVSAIPPVALTALESGGAWAGIVFVAFVVINSVADNVIKPKYMGEGFGIPFSVIALAFLGWGFILGAFGALLAVPLTLALMKAAPLLREPKS
jgi:predicted PurR-regulated permease PerM